jgi:hypothetical protein
MLSQAGKTVINGSSVHRAYDLNGVMLAIAAAEERLAAFLDPILAPLSCTIPAACDWIASMSPVAEIEPPVGEDRIFEGPLPEGLPAIMIQKGDERVLVVPAHFAMSFQRNARKTEIRFVPGKESGLGGTAAFWLLDNVLAAHGRHLLHGALLVDPTTDKSIALWAPSGTGKSTTTLALARAGLHLAGDDALVLDASTRAGGLWAIPRKIKVHRQTAALLPWLGPILANSWTADEQALDLGALSPLVALATPKPRQAELLIALQPPNNNDHVVAAITKPEALVAIARDNLRTAPGGVDADDAAALAALAGLIARTRVISLSVGPNPSTLSRALLGLS